MKLSRSLVTVFVGFALSSPAAFACNLPTTGAVGWVHHIIHPDEDSAPPPRHHGEHGSQPSSGCGGSKSSCTTTPPATTPTSPKS